MDLTASMTKVTTIKELGAATDDRVEAAHNETNQYAGAVRALTDAVRLLQELHQHAGKDLEAGRFAELSDLQVQAVAKRYIDRAIGVLNNMTLQLEQSRLRACGKEEALQQSVKILKQLHDSEMRKIERLQKLEQEPPTSSTPREVGQHPGDPLAERRAETQVEEAPQAEASAEPNKSDTPVAEDVGG